MCKVMFIFVVVALALQIAAYSVSAVPQPSFGSQGPPQSPYSECYDDQYPYDNSRPYSGERYYDDDRRYPQPQPNPNGGSGGGLPVGGILGAKLGLLAKKKQIIGGLLGGGLGGNGGNGGGLLG
ncbi:eggshell protein 1 [Manduca sexta]|uniref:eggshell protein 1 n=1 Tax=Manduca sexta TaxID=7130 RepID=UPI00118248C7|nr:eggshell protein 1 [Manduca sexta]